MRSILNQTWTIAANTVRDILRRPIVLLLTAACVILTGLLPSAAVFAFGDEERLVRDGAMAFHLVFGLLIASTASAATIYTEIKRGTAATVLCKPVSRSVYFLSAYAGILIVISLFCLIAMAAGLLSVRMVVHGMNLDGRVGAIFMAAVLAAFAYAAANNFLFRRSFVSQALIGLFPCLAIALVIIAGLDTNGHLTRFGSLMAWQMIPGGILTSLAVMVLAALAVSFSTRLPPILGATACAIMFFLGLLADYLFGSAAAKFWVAKLIYLLLPNWQDFWVADTLAGSASLPWGYVGMAAAYAALYAAATLFVGLLSFRRVEIM